MDEKEKELLRLLRGGPSEERALELRRELAGVPREARAAHILKRIAEHEPLCREAEMDRATIDEESRTFEFSFSSEIEVERWFGFEILDHSPGACRLGRLKDRGAFCVNHDLRNGQIGVHEDAWISDSRRGRAKVRLSKSPHHTRALQEWDDIKDGIRCHISDQYIVHGLKLLEERKDGDVYLITDWEPLENSTVAAPADTSVGIGKRSLETRKEPQMPPEEKRETAAAAVADPPPPAVDVRAVGEEARKAERERVSLITAMGRKFGQTELADKHINEGTSVAEFQRLLLDSIKPVTPPTSSAQDVGLTGREVQRFSLVRLFRALANPMERSYQASAGFEFEAAAAARKLIAEPGGHGMTIPGEVLRARMERGQALTPDTAGGYLESHTQASSMIEYLTAATKILQLGAQPYGNLVGTMDLPKETGMPTAYVVGEDEAVPASGAAIGALTLSKKTVGVRVYLTRDMIRNVSFDSEAWVRRMAFTAAGLKFDSLGLTGIGGRHQPIGLLNWPGIECAVGGENGAAPGWDLVVNMEGLCDQQNALLGKLAYLFNAKTKSKLKRTPKHATAAVDGWVWEKGTGADPTVGEVNGYPAHVSNQVPSNLVKGTSGAVCSAGLYGNWNDYVIATWGGVDVIVDPFSSSSQGGTWVTLFFDMDMVPLRAQSFSTTKDILTS